MPTDTAAKPTWELVLDRIKAKRAQYRDLGDTPTPRYDVLVENVVLDRMHECDLDDDRIIPSSLALCSVLDTVGMLERLHRDSPTLRHSMLVDSAITLALEVAGEVLAERENRQ